MMFEEPRSWGLAAWAVMYARLRAAGDVGTRNVDPGILRVIITIRMMLLKPR